MQELIDRLDYLIGLSNETMYEFGLKVAKKEAKSMLEKEQEQLNNVWLDGRNSRSNGQDPMEQIKNL